MSAPPVRPPYTSLAVLALALLAAIVWSYGPPTAARPEASASPFSKMGTLTDIAFYADGERVRLADYRGRPVVLNLWATWCAPCVAEMPSLDRLQRAFPDVTVIALSLDKGGEDKIRMFFAEQKLENLKIFTDPSMKAMVMLGVPGLPATFLINAQGREVGVVHGAFDWDSKEGRDAVSALRSGGGQDSEGDMVHVHSPARPPRIDGIFEAAHRSLN